MKKYILFLFILFSLVSNKLEAQNTWFKILPGFEVQKNHLTKGDTVISIGQTNIGTALIILLTYSDLKTGQFYRTDTIDYFQISKDSLTSNEYRLPDQSYYDQNNGKLLIGFNYVDTLKGKYKWQSAIFKTYPLEKLPYKLNHDTFNTKIEGYQKIGRNYFAVIQWVKYIGKLGGLTSYKLLKLKNDYSNLVIRDQINATSCANCHAIWYEKLLGDNRNIGNLFLQQKDQWDWHGVPASFQDEIVKMDTNGTTIWKCRPNNRDSVNTSAFKMVQKPNGNIICCWNDYYHPPYKSPTGDNLNEDHNDSATIWFAEIDYQTGKVLWRKNIRRYLFSKFTTKEEITRTIQDVAFYDVKVVNSNSLVWVGYRIGGYPDPFNYKYMAIIFKTDLSCNPVWYREHEIFPSDTGDKGMKVFNFEQTSDKGFLLAGVYENQYGQVSGGEFWRKGALMKLDSFGCLKKDCQKTDAVSKIESESKLCVVYPNPGCSNITIQLPKNKPCEYTLKIYATDGKLLVNIFLDSDYILNTSGFNSGIYLFIITNSKSQHSEIHKISIIR